MIWHRNMGHCSLLWILSSNSYDPIGTCSWVFVSPAFGGFMFTAFQHVGNGETWNFLPAYYRSSLRISVSPISEVNKFCFWTSRRTEPRVSIGSVCWFHLYMICTQQQNFYCIMCSRQTIWKMCDNIVYICIKTLSSISWRWYAIIRTETILYLLLKSCFPDLKLFTQSAIQ